MYTFVDSFVSKDKIDIDKLKMAVGTDENIVIYQNKVGYVSGNKKNPLDDIYVYKTKDMENPHKLTAIKQNKEQITMLMPSVYQEYLTMIF